MMKKQFVSMLLVMALLLCTLPGQAAILSKEERYGALLDELKRYLNDDDAMPLKSQTEEWGELGRYEMSPCFLLYTQALLALEQGRYDEAGELCAVLEGIGDFCTYVEEADLGSVEKLKQYALGRQAEDEQRFHDALGHYGACPLFLDSTSRIVRLKSLVKTMATATPAPTPVPTPVPTANPTPRPVPTRPPYEPYDMGVPYLGGRVFGNNEMNIYVYWVQVQMKKTGRYYQDPDWDETGNLGSRTMSEIQRFMRDRGYSNHSGQVDQQVINELASYLGSRVEPVYMGGYYDKMNVLMRNAEIQDMYDVESNLRDGVPRVSEGARWMQVCLQGLGYYTSTIDGKFGEGTERALKRFQRDYGFVERDYLSLGVARALLEAYYSSGCDLNRLP